jgi:glyoxylase-like metal-dependent hydrolase (beta-lactamase superfamily II)
MEIPIPVNPVNPLRTTNSYVVKGPKRNLIIDTGLGEPESMEAMGEALGQLAVDLSRTDYFITHIHPDHFGFLSRLTEKTAHVYVNQREMDWFDVINQRDGFLRFARLNGFSDDELDAASRKTRVLESSLNRNLRFHFLKEGDAVEVGDMVFRCIETPGHTRGHLCLFEPERRIFLAGDHILPTISPVLEFMRVDGWEPLREYLAGLEKIRCLDIELILPGHGAPFRGHRERIDELKAQHNRRLRKVLSLLKKGQQTAFQLASSMTRQDSWDLLPLFEKIIVVGETVAHLAYLEKDGDVGKQVMEDQIVYSLEGVHGNGTS